MINTERTESEAPMESYYSTIKGIYDGLSDLGSVRRFYQRPAEKVSGVLFENNDDQSRLAITRNKNGSFLVSFWGSHYEILKDGVSQFTTPPIVLQGETMEIAAKVMQNAVFHTNHDNRRFVTEELVKFTQAFMTPKPIEYPFQPRFRPILKQSK